MVGQSRGVTAVKVSIVIPTWNGEDEIGECLRGVFAQQADVELEVLVIDSSSTDRTLEIARGFPVRVHIIRQADFSHGDTRNLGAQLTDGELIVFLVQDAYPQQRDWLATLVANFQDPAVGAVFCRILPRPTAGMLVRKGVEGDLCYGERRIENQIRDGMAVDDAGGSPPRNYLSMDPLERRLFINFNDVCSCMRRSVWERLPFARVQFGEDLLWAKAALEAGFKVVFEPRAPVVHSHEYDPKTLRARTRIDAWLNRAYLDRECIRRRRDVLIMTRRVARGDQQYLKAHGVKPWKRFKLGLLSHYYHLLEFWGFHTGSHVADRLVAPAAVARPHLKVLFVVHGFPPETMAGTEVLTLSLAKGLQAAGHEVVVFHRVADPTLENYALRDGEYDGLRVIQIANHLVFRNIEETYRNRPIEERFREVLARERPDVVHFEHMIHLSATLAGICREQGIGSVVTLNDFWFRCPKVQLIRPDQQVCSSKPPILGCAACVANLPRLIGPMRVVSRPLHGWIARLGAFYNAWSRRRPQLHRKLWSDLACLAQRPSVALRELLHADFIIAPSPFLKAKMIEAGIPRERLIASDYGMETAWLQSYRRSDGGGRLRFGFIGSLVWYKGLEVLARAFQRLSSAGVELHIYGDTEGMPEFRETRRRIEQHVSREGLHFHGRYNPAQLGLVLGAIDVLVVPSVWYENSPLAIHEAFQARVPVLVSDRGGMRDLVEDGVGGLRFRPGDDADLARVMERFVADPGLLDRIASRAPAVKTVAENVAEMEVKYRQAAGLHLAHRLFTRLSAADFVASSGAVEKHGDGSVELRPGGANGALIEYSITTSDALLVELEVEVRHNPGDAAPGGGEVRLNGRGVLRIDPSTGGRLPPARYFTAVRLVKGVNRISVANRIPGVAGGVYPLRVQALSLMRTSSRIG